MIPYESFVIDASRFLKEADKLSAANYKYWSIVATVAAALRGDYDYLPLSSDQFHLDNMPDNRDHIVCLLPSPPPQINSRRQPPLLPVSQSRPIRLTYSEPKVSTRREML